MQVIYSFFISLVELLLPISKLFSPKMKLFVNGRKKVFTIIKKNMSPQDKVIWLHVASLGEYEQGVPILEELKSAFPNYKFLITFFSPSGYEVKKNNASVDLTTYLPLDTPKNAKAFIKLAHPALAIFVKYEIWPNYLQEIKNQNIPALLISGNFREDQVYFRSYTCFMKDALQTFDHLFVQNTASKNLLYKEGFKNVSVSGDTRFDRVSKQLYMDNRLGFVEEFKEDKLCIVCGSTWPEDENLLIDYMNKSPENVKFIIAPHQINPKNIINFQNKLVKPSVLYSQRDENSLNEFSILIVDMVGLLTKIYAYADIAYVGGAAGNTGLHNILEPAAFGLPILIGKNHEKFPEASKLLKEKGLFSIKSSAECFHILKRLVSEERFRKKTGENSHRFIEKNKGATKIVMDYIINTIHLK